MDINWHVALILLWTITKCFGSKATYSCGISSDPLTLSCPDQTIVTAIVKLGFRPSGQTGNCTYQVGDCLQDAYMDRARITDCVFKKNKCTIQFISLEFQVSCGLTSQKAFIVANNFECVKAEDIHQICVTTTQELDIYDNNDTKVITSPGFQGIPYSQYKGMDFNKTLCSVTIITTPGYGIRIRSIYMDLAPEHSLILTLQSINFQERFSEQNDVDIVVDSHIVDIMFDFQGEKGNIGFALHYESVPINNSNANVSDNISQTTQVETITDSNIPQQSETATQKTTIDPPNGSTKIIVIISITLALLLFLLVAIMVIILLTYRRHNAKGPMSETKNNAAVSDQGARVKKGDADVDTKSISGGSML